MTETNMESLFHKDKERGHYTQNEYIKDIWKYI